MTDVLIRVKHLNQVDIDLKFLYCTYASSVHLPTKGQQRRNCVESQIKMACYKSEIRRNFSCVRSVNLSTDRTQCEKS